MLITKEYIRQNFPQWSHYAEFDTSTTDLDEALDNQIAQAEDELAEYVTITDGTMTDSLRRHLFHIARYNLFMLQHADTQFDRDPQIVQDYQRSIQMLTQLRDGERPATPSDPNESQGKVKIRAKRRRFGGDSWFREVGNDIVSSDDNN